MKTAYIFWGQYFHIAPPFSTWGITFTDCPSVRRTMASNNCDVFSNYINFSLTCSIVSLLCTILSSDSLRVLDVLSEISRFPGLHFSKYSLYSSILCTRCAIWPPAYSTVVAKYKKFQFDISCNTLSVVNELARLIDNVYRYSLGPGSNLSSVFIPFFPSLPVLVGRSDVFGI